MIRTAKPRNARSKRAFDNKQPKLIENVKNALFIPGTNCSAVVDEALNDLLALKKPNGKKFSKKNPVHPFEDASSLEFFSEKNDSSLLVLGYNSKKRPQSVLFVRTFGYQIYDMIELHIQTYKFLKDFKKRTFNIGCKPIIQFNGGIFESHPLFIHVKSLFLDFYRGETLSKLDLSGIQHVISISAQEYKEGLPLPTIHFRVYLIKTKKSGQKLPLVELDEIGPRFDFKIGRNTEPSPELEKEAMRKPKQLDPKVKKNVETDLMGDKIAKIHVGKQNLNNLQTRKMKGLKRKDNEINSDHLEDEIVDEVNPPTKKSKK